MAMNKLTDIQKLSMDVYNGVSIVFNEANGEDAIRNLITDSIGGEWNFYNYKQNQWKFFQIVSEIIEKPMEQTLEGVFKGITKVETIPLGDVKVVNVEDNNLFEVATISVGNNNVSRQGVYHNQVTIKTEKKAIKIYDDFDRFMSGRINFPKLIERLKKSFANEVAKQVYDAVLSSYDSSSTAKWSKTGSFDEDKLDELIQRVEGKTGKKCAIYGTKTALGKVSQTLVSDYVTSDEKINEYMAFGQLKNYKNGTMMIPIVNPINKNDEFILDDDYLFILPEGEEIINLVLEGSPLIMEDTTGTARADQQIELLYEQGVGVAVLIAKYYGIYKLA